MAGWWYSLGPPVSSTNKTDHHDITEILLKVALSTITLTPNPFFKLKGWLTNILFYTLSNDCITLFVKIKWLSHLLSSIDTIWWCTCKMLLQFPSSPLSYYWLEEYHWRNRGLKLIKFLSIWTCWLTCLTILLAINQYLAQCYKKN